MELNIPEYCVVNEVCYKDKEKPEIQSHDGRSQISLLPRFTESDVIGFYHNTISLLSNKC